MVDTIHKTLIIRFSSVGDIILSSLLLRVLRKRFPTCQIDFLTKTEYADLVKYNPNVTRVIEFSGQAGGDELRKLRTAIHDTSYDLVIDIHDSLRSRFLCFGLSGVVRVHKRKIARFLLVKTKWDVYDLFGGAPNVAERYLEIVANWGIVNDENGLEVFFPEAAARRAHDILQDAAINMNSPIIGISPSARHNTKQWLKERFAETASTIAREYNAAILLFGAGGNEETRGQEIRTMIKRSLPDSTVVNLAGKVSLTETAAIMDFCSLLITNDSGLMHLAAARKKKIVAIFGSTVRELGFFPYGTTSTVIENIGLSCRPCTHIGLQECPKGHFKCMNNIEADTVIDAARLLLKS